MGRAMRHGRSPIDGRGPKGPVVSLARRAKREVTRGPVLPGRPTEVVGRRRVRGCESGAGPPSPSATRGATRLNVGFCLRCVGWGGAVGVAYLNSGVTPMGTLPNTAPWPQDMRPEPQLLAYAAFYFLMFAWTTMRAYMMDTSSKRLLTISTWKRTIGHLQTLGTISPVLGALPLLQAVFQQVPLPPRWEWGGLGQRPKKSLCAQNRPQISGPFDKFLFLLEENFSDVVWVGRPGLARAPNIPPLPPGVPKQ